MTLLSDKVPAAAEPLPQKKRLVLQPRSVPVEAISTSPAAESESSHSEEEASIEMTEEAALKKISEDLKEFFAVRNPKEAEVYFSSLPPQYHHLLVDRIVSTAVESKENDAKLVSQFFVVAASKKLCSAASFEKGLTPVAEVIDDIVIDAPKAFQLLAMMVNSAGLDQERLSNLASKSFDSDKFLALFQADQSSESTVQPFCNDTPRLNLASVVVDCPSRKKPDSSLATGSGELGEASPSHQSPYGSMGPPSTNPSAPPSVIPLSSHAPGSGRNYEAEWLQINLNSLQEVLHLQQRQFEEEKMTMNRHFKEQLQIQRAQFDAERVFYQSQIMALSGYHGGESSQVAHKK